MSIWRSQHYTPLNSDLEPNRTALKGMLLICAAVITGPVLLFALWRIIANWGWWLPLVGFPDATNPLLQESRYIKTWRGWKLAPVRHEEKPKERSPMLRSRSVLRDWNEVFWDSTTGKIPTDVKDQSWHYYWTRSRKNDNDEEKAREPMVPEAYTCRSSEIVAVSESLSLKLSKPELCLLNHGRRKPTPSSGPNVPDPSRETVTLQKSSDSRSEALRQVNKTLRPWVSAMIIDPSTLQPGDGGISGRRPSPEMGWKNLTEGAEALHSLSLPSPLGGSIRHSRSADLGGRLCQVYDGTGDYPSPSQRAPLHQSYGQGESAEHVKPRWYDKHRKETKERPSLSFLYTKHTLSLPFLSTEGGHHKPDRALYTSLSRSRAVVASGSMDEVGTGVKVPDVVPSGGLTIPEKTFIDHLDRKLNWLHHELSPGFRTLDDNPAECFRIVTRPQWTVLTRGQGERIETYAWILRRSPQG
ncbi:MAG: hypothetical protein M1824_003092 [Vezdaea acicularis]|nr:MAG: hypothetical protein M1824_003092 [Vezdaea acicularis]